MSESVESAERTIVVGVDGSEASKDALRWAARQAELTGAVVHAVMVWHVPVAAHGALIPADLEHDWEASTHQTLQRVLVDTLGEHTPARLRCSVVRGHPATELLKAARDAELLVVGGRGHGAFTGMLLGSVSQRCASHAPCPVVVVRHSPHPA